jgi:protocatechuate 3,4-dioxygenase alpha subunit
MADLTPFQTVGPYFAIAMPAPGIWRLAGPAVAGERIRVEGRVLDGAGQPVPDALIETWQADAEGRYPDPAEPDRGDGFAGFGRVPTDEAGGFAFETVRPGAVPGPLGALQAPHLLVSVLARGILTRLVTRIYFEDEPTNATDPVLRLVPAARRSTLLARRSADGPFRIDLVLQGPNETVFFDV